MGARPGEDRRPLTLGGVGLSCEGRVGEVGLKEGRRVGRGATPNTLQLDLYTA